MYTVDVYTLNHVHTYYADSPADLSSIAELIGEEQFCGAANCLGYKKLELIQFYESVYGDMVWLYTNRGYI